MRHIETMTIPAKGQNLECLNDALRDWQECFVDNPKSWFQCTVELITNLFEDCP